ncbi:MAG: potassium channel family protein [Coriobacteriales bacterium]|jgi:trk system potassium uptake protein TrkA
MALINRKRALICGCGRFGAALADALDQDGYRVTVVDMNDEAFDRLGEFDGETLTGDCTNSTVLEEAGVQRAELFASATGRDSTNVLAAEIASDIYGVGHVYARIEDEDLIEVIEDRNIEPICPHLVCLDEFFRLTGLNPQKGVRR